MRSETMLHFKEELEKELKDNILSWWMEYTPDRELGGVYWELDTDIHWWPQAEAMVGYYNAFQLSGEQKYLKRSIGSWEFIKKHLIDHKHGEWFWSVDSQGNPQTEKEKAGFWKCPYHNGRACMELIHRIESR